MTAEQLINQVRAILPQASICATVAKWHMSHIEGDGVNVTYHHLSIQPGLNGEKCTGWDCDSFAECGEQFQAAVIKLMESAAVEKCTVCDIQSERCYCATESNQVRQPEVYADGSVD